MPYNFVPDSFHTGATAEAQWAKIEWKSTISHQRGHFDPKYQVQVVAPTNHFWTLVRPMNALQLCRWQFSHKETF